MFCVGLTGGIGCGKSRVAQAFAALGAAIIDTDAIAHDLTRPEQIAHAAILRLFGTDYAQDDGSLDRARLRRLIFSDNQAKAQLETLLHPLIFEQVLDQLRRVDAPYAILVVPLLFETAQYLPLIQRSLVVDCDEVQQIARTCARSGLSESEVRAIMSQQIERARRLRQADDVISNSGDGSDLGNQVAHLHDLYLALRNQAKP